MTSHLYNREILRLATALSGQQPLENAHGSADRRSPTCGSRVIVDVKLDDNALIMEIAIDARACALGQASAALVLAHAVGRSAEEMRSAAESLRSYLTGGAQQSDFWPGIEVFDAAQAYPARHPSILLAFEATHDAAESALAAQKGQAA